MTAVETDIRDIKGILQRLEPVVDRLDVMVQRLEPAIRKVEIDVAELKGRMSQLPTSIQMIGLVLAVLAISGATHWASR